jgi:hypothetical protein
LRGKREADTPLDPAALRGSERWRSAQLALERCTAPPELRLA